LAETSAKREEEKDSTPEQPIMGKIRLFW